MYNKAYMNHAIFDVKAASQQRVMISLMTGNIIYIRKISRYVQLSNCTLLRIVQNSNKTKKIGTNTNNSKASSEVRLVV